MNLLKGKPVADNIIESVKAEIKDLKSLPTLAIVRVGDDPGDKWYQDFAVKRVESVGARAKSCSYPADITREELIANITDLSEDRDIHGILLLSNIPDHLNLDEIVEYIDPDKDVDGLLTANMGRLIKGAEGFVPGTPLSVMEILDYYDIPLEGKDVIVIGRSQIVGLPLALLLLDANATVQIAHSRSEDIADLVADKDIIISATGYIGVLDGSAVPNGAVVIDVATNEDEAGNMVGDITNISEMEDRDISYTPVPGGVGSVTTAVLIKNLLKAYKIQNNI